MPYHTHIEQRNTPTKENKMNELVNNIFKNNVQYVNMMIAANAKVLTSNVNDELQYTVYDSENNSEAVIRYSYETHIVDFEVKYFNNPVFGNFNCNQSIADELLDHITLNVFFDELEEIANKQAKQAEEARNITKKYPHLKPIPYASSGGYNHEFLKATAKNIKKHLQHLFPQCKFSVTCDSGRTSSSIDVQYKGNPDASLIRDAVKIFENWTDGFSECFGYSAFLFCQPDYRN